MRRQIDKSEPAQGLLFPRDIEAQIAERRATAEEILIEIADL